MTTLSIQDLFSVAGKTVLVTGGSRGIGEMIAAGFLANGSKVYISSRKAAVCDATAARLSQVSGQTCVSVPGELATAGGVASLAAAIGKSEDHLDVLVNNAGTSWGARLDDFPENGWDKVMDTNVKGIFFLTQQLLTPLEKAARPGDPARVISIGSIEGIKVPRVENYSYSPSKAAVHHMTRVLAVWLGRRNITVNAIAPGPFESQMTKWMLEHMRDDIEKACPLKRIGAPGDMAGISIYLASRAGAYVNGTVIPVDGGICIS